jgi:hypothetical protein
MSIRWLAAVLLFSLGFGSALVVKSLETGVAPREGTIVGKLRYRDTGTDFQLIRPAEDRVNYLVVVTKKGTDAAPQVAFPNEKLTLHKVDTGVVGIYQVIPLATVKVSSSVINSIKCRPTDYCPLPPDPGPPPGGPIRYVYQFLLDPSAMLKPGR